MAKSAASNTDTGAIYSPLRALVGGMDLSTREDVKPEGKLQNVQNLYPKQGSLLVDTGYAKFGDVVRGDPQATYQFYKKDGSSELIGITTDTLYKYDSVNDEWNYISSGTSTTADAGEPAGETVLSVTDTAGFSVNDFIGVALDNGQQHKTKVTAVSAGTPGTLTMQDAVPTGRTIAVAASVIQAKELSGSLSIQVSIVTWAASDEMIFTNGVEVPQTYDGTSVSDIQNLPSSGNLLAKGVAIFRTHLIFINTTEGGTAFPQRVRWSDTADLTEWVTGNAGYQDLWDSEDFLITAQPLGPYLIIYRERGIVRTTYLGTADKLFRFTPTITGEGAVSHESVINLGDSHLFRGNSNFYEYNGSFSIKPVGDELYDLIFGIAGEADPTYKVRDFALYIEELDEAWFFYTVAGDTLPKKVARYNISKGSWMVRTLPITVSGFGFFESIVTRTWATLTGTWLDQTWAWNSKLFLSNSTTIHLCDAGTNQVFEYNFIAADDDGTDIDYILETGDFYSPQNFIRMDRVDLNMKGNAVSVWVSFDQGDTWELLGTVNPGVTYTTERFEKQYVSMSIRFRVTGTGGGFGIRWLGLKFYDESEY